MIPPLLALLAWIPIALYFFRRYRIRVAILITFLGGWGLLPGASFAQANAGFPLANTAFPFWILPSSLPSIYFLTKGTVTSIAALLGVWLTDRQFYRRFALSFWDLPMLIWCTIPMLAGIANPAALAQGIGGSIYQSLAWGVPYLLGRLYFSETDSLQLAAVGMVTAGLAYVPICLVEVFTGPQLYAHLYGFQPYRWHGAVRYIGYRPIGFLEDGNQLGIWMATAALIAIWLWKRHSVERILRIPIGWVAILLFLVTLLCQSVGSILLLLALLPFVFVSQRYLPRLVTALIVIGILSFGSLRLANVISLRRMLKQDPAVREAAHFLKEIKRDSLGWRLEQEERHLGVALETPLFGSGEWDWWQGGQARPWGLWLLAFGMYGFVGLAALECLQLLPVARIVWFPLARSDIQAFNLRYALAAAILMSAVDNLLNSAMILPLLLVIGGMTTWKSAVSEVLSEIQGRPTPTSETNGKQWPATDPVIHR